MPNSNSFLPSHTSATRRRRRPSSPRSDRNCTRTAAAACCGRIVLLWIIIAGTVVAVLFLLWTLTRGGRVYRHRIWIKLLPSWASSSSIEPRLRLDDFPSDLVDVWPDNNPLRNIPPSHQHSSQNNKDPQLDKSNQNLLTQVFSTNCLPTAENAAICQQRKIPTTSSTDGTTTTNTERIGILRPPGVWGDIFETFVIQYVELSRTEHTNMDLISTSHIDTSTQPHSYTKILRPAVLPLVLAALDLVLYCEDPSPSRSGTALTRIDHVLDVVRQLVRWHCRLSHVARDTALLTLPMDQLLANPMQIEKELVQFLNLRHERQRDLHVNMDALARQAFQRIDASARRMQELLVFDHNQNDGPQQRIADQVWQIVTQEQSSGICHLNPFRGDSIDSTPVTEMVGRLMDGHTIESICLLYPTAALCDKKKRPPE